MKLAVLHLSDIHFRTKPDSVSDRAVEISEQWYATARLADHCLIVVTGDIAFSGETAEYVKATTFLQEIKQSIEADNGKPVDILVVPGNHDCTLKPDNPVRESVIQTILSTPAKAEERALVDCCVLAQANFFHFQKTVETLAPVSAHPLWREYQLALGGKTIAISALNVAWMSQLKEQAGTLVFPAHQFEGEMTRSADLRLTLLHHPYNWHQQSSYHDLKQKLRSHSDAVLNGHEHFGNSGMLKEEASGRSLFFESGALQPEAGEGEPSFAGYIFDLTAQQVSVDRYTLNSNTAISKSTTVIWPLPSRTEKNEKRLDMKLEWLEKLDNSGGYFKHPEKEHLFLSDVFVFPDVTDMDAMPPGKISNKSAESLISAIKEGTRFLILGEDRAGKTSLLYAYIQRLRQAGFAVVYLPASELAQIKKLEDVAPRVDRFVEMQYANPLAVRGLAKSKRILIVDDIDRFKSGMNAIPALLTYADQQFTSVILSANPSFEVATLVSASASGMLTTFKRYQLMPFGTKLRHKLIKTWWLLGNVETSMELDQRVDEAERIMNAVIGKNLVPALPLYLLILLQSTDRHARSEIQNSGLSHYYQYLITTGLAASDVRPGEFDEYYNYLSRMAWAMQVSGGREMDMSELRDFNETFSKSYTAVDLGKRLKTLVNARILVERGPYYSFAYPYVYYFFLGKHLASGLYSDTAIRTWVEDACTKLYLRDKANAILFLTHHANDVWVIRKVSEVIKTCFTAHKPMEFNGDIDRINKLVTQSAQLILDAPDINHNQEHIREIKDVVSLSQGELPEIAPDGDEDLAYYARFILLLKTAEILGQILKNYYGSLEKPLKAELLQEVFDGPLRGLRILFDQITADMEGFVADIRGAIEQETPGLEGDKLAMAARRTSFQMLQWLGTGVVTAAAGFVSSDKLQDDIREVVAAKPTVAYRLIENGARLIRPGQLPIQQILKLATDLKDNHYAFHILQGLVVHHLYMFHTDVHVKQQLCNALNISMQNVKGIEAKSQKVKMVGR